MLKLIVWLRAWNWELAGGVFMGLLVWLCLPDRVVAIDDDYGYLRSIQETWQKGRPWTNEFLVPFAVTTSLLTCGLFALTGSMVVGVHGALALCAMVFYVGFVAVLRYAGVSRWLAALTGVLVLTGPTVFFMLLMFTSVPVYWAGLVMCVAAAVKKKWGWFAIAFVLSLATRQSALVWLAVPGWLLVEQVWASRARWPRVKISGGPVVAIMIGVGAFVALKLGMNETNGQRVAEEAMARMPGGGIMSFVGVLTIVGGYGWACLLLGIGQREQVSRGRWLPAIFGALLGVGLAIWALGLLYAVHNCYIDTWAKPTMGVMGAVAGLGLVLYPRLPWWPALMTGIAAWLPQLIYVSGFDYYYIETFLWGLVAALFGRSVRREALVMGTGAKGGFLERGLVRWVGVALAATVLVWNGRCLIKHKLSQDRSSAFCQLYEKALDEGLLLPHEVGFSPFGYAGWLFDEHFLANGGVRPGGFVAYMDAWNGERGTGVLTFYPRYMDKRRKSTQWFPAHSSSSLRNHPEASVVASIDAKILWFWKARFEIRRVHREDQREDLLALDYGNFTREVFPLNDAEWRKLMAGDRTLGRAGQESE